MHSVLCSVRVRIHGRRWCHPRDHDKRSSISAWENHSQWFQRSWTWVFLHCRRRWSQSEYFYLKSIFLAGFRNGWFQAWIIKKNTKAPQAAGRIHTDFEKGFIMAEVMDWEAWEQERSEAKVKALGRYRQQGKTYIVKNGDIIFFKFNTPNAPKKK